MWSLAHHARRPEQAAAVLPEAFPSLSARQINIRRGEVSMIAGAPGAGKSTLALAYAAKSHVPTLYFSADTHRHTMRMRLLSMLTGMPQVTAEKAMQQDPEWAADELLAAEHIKWCWESAPSLRDVELYIEAFAEATGEDPHLVVFDNLIDATYDSGDEWGSLRSLMREFKWWARETGAAFVVLHHTSEGVPGNPCPPRHSIQGKVAQTPALILTVTGETEGFMGIASVKNRYGPAQASGSNPVWLMYDPARMLLADLEDR